MSTLKTPPIETLDDLTNMIAKIGHVEAHGSMQAIRPSGRKVHGLGPQLQRSLTHLQRAEMGTAWTFGPARVRAPLYLC